MSIATYDPDSRVTTDVLERVDGFEESRLVQRADYKSYLTPAGRLEYTLPEDLDEEERHDHVLEQVLAVEKAAADEYTWFISHDEFDNTRSGKQIGGFLEEYGAYMDDLCADGGRAVFEPEDVVALYNVDHAYEAVIEELDDTPVSTIVVEEAQYFPKKNWKDGSKALRSKGELDVGKFTFAGDRPHVTYVEVKSNGHNGLSKAKKQLNRFARYAKAIGWDVSCQMALYDDETENIFFFDHQPH